MIDDKARAAYKSMSREQQDILHRRLGCIVEKRAYRATPKEENLYATLSAEQREAFESLVVECEKEVVHDRIDGTSERGTPSSG